MNTMKSLLLASLFAACFAAPANAAWYAKFDGVDGSSKAQAACGEKETATREGASRRAASDEDATCAAAYGKDGSKGGNVEVEWKVEEGE